MGLLIKLSLNSPLNASGFLFNYDENKMKLNINFNVYDRKRDMAFLFIGR